MDRDVLCAVQHWQAARRGGVHQVAGDLGLAIDHHGLAGQARHIDPDKAFAIGQVEAFLDQPFSLEPRVEAEPFHQPDGDLFQHPGADARQHVIGCLAFHHHTVDAFGPQQVAKEQAGRTGADNGNLGFHGTHLPLLWGRG